MTDSEVGAADTILGFTIGDLINLSAIDADVHTAGNQAFTFIGAGNFTGVAGQLRAVNVMNDDWSIQADTGGDGTADMAINLTTADGSIIDAGDFVV